MQPDQPWFESSSYAFRGASMNDFLFGVDLNGLDNDILLQGFEKFRRVIERRRVQATHARPVDAAMHPDVTQAQLAAKRMAESRDVLDAKRRRDQHEALKDRVRRGVIDTNGWHLLNCVVCLDTLFRDDLGAMHEEGRYDYQTLVR
jgi:hypothetical protein